MATLFDSASLVMIPSGYKDDKLYSIKPTNGDGDFTFSRDGSGASPATRVNASGLIEKGRENLLLQSNQFDTTWSLSSATITGGQADKDGGNSAWLLESSINGSAYIQQASTQSGVQTFSFYAKAGTTDWVRVIGDSSPDYLAFYDLTNGVVGATLGGANIDTSIESVGGGWYRCSISGNATISRVILNVAEADNDILVSTGDNIYIQDAQLEQGLVATDYIETTTAPVSAGLLGDMPRLDYSGGATCPSLLLEPSRVNNIAQSEYFGGTYWAKGAGVSVVDNNYTSPEGLTNGAKLVGATGTDRNGSVIGRIMSVSSSTTYTATIYVYQDTATQCTLYLRDGSTGVIVSQSVTLESGWQRIEKSLTTGASTTQMNWYLGNTDGDIGIYGAQLESASYPTSYIPTYGSASTRGDDYSYTALSGNADFGTGDFSVFFDVENVDDDGSGATAIVGNRQSGEWWRFYGNKGQNRFHLEVSTTAGGYNASIIGTYEQFKDGRNKVVISRNSSRLICYVNGVEKINSTSAVFKQNFDSTNTRLELNAWQNGANANTNVNFHQLLIFKGTALTSAECQSLTTL